MRTAVEAPAVSITIVLHNSAHGLRECLQSIEPELERGFAELIAVDNATPDESVAIVERHAPGVRILRAGRNLGFAAGVNLAWPHARGRYWLLLNPDAMLFPGGLRALVDWMDARPEVAIGSPAFTDGDERDKYPTARALPSASLVMLELLRIHRVLPRSTRARLLQGPYWTGDDFLGAGWVPGTAMIARREAVERVGLLDEDFFLFGEDIEWCWRMRRAGWKVGYCSSVAIRHAGQRSSFRTFGEREAHLLGAQGQIEAVRKGRGGVRARAFATAVTTQLALESVHPRRSEAVRRRARTLLKAWYRATLGPRRTTGI